MEVAELRCQVEALGARLRRNADAHAAAIAALRDETAALRRRLSASSSASSASAMPRDDSKTRRAEWRIENASELLAGKPRTTGLWSPDFSIMGANMRLEFYPRGQEGSSQPGFCALFLWCSGNVRLKYQLQVGQHRGAIDCDFFEAGSTPMGHGHKNFCLLEAQIDATTNSILVAVDVLELAWSEDRPGGLRYFIESPEVVIARSAEALHNADLSTVSWRLKDVRQRVAGLHRGQALCSSLFDVAGVKGAMLEFYPLGVGATPSSPAKDGYCGLYLRCRGGATLTVTLSVGSAKKGPIKADFVGFVGKGVPELCRFEDQIPGGEQDLLLGVVIVRSEGRGGAPQTLNL
eukprot:TRINITY_DN13109_c0_g1_i1.p1 TRINITY_DN13109_c0_g1~~TRINITY_DN13109_c0_g1_i1.p1  ORF type:complete len:349 (-),score=75.23 TRINITY_DN13109_c0_g1_i1:28-1074(-)